MLAKVDLATGAIYTYHTNYLGAVHQLTNASGTVVWEAEYKPFGEAAVNPGSTVVSNWRMLGQYFDAESGLYYNYHRYYDPGVGRYLTPDPFGLVGGINPYVYTSNNPVNAVDPHGLIVFAIPPVYYAVAGLAAVVAADCATNGIAEAPGVNIGADQIFKDAVILSLIFSTGVIDLNLLNEGSWGNGDEAHPNIESGGAAPNGDDDPDDPRKPKRVTNLKHHPNSKSPEPKNAQKLFDRSIVDKNGVRWAKDSDGTIHRFSKPSNGESHWNGSNSGVRPIRMNDIPHYIRKALK